MPLLGPALGPLIGGALGNVSSFPVVFDPPLPRPNVTATTPALAICVTPSYPNSPQSFGWRSSYYFLAAFAGVVEVMFLFFPDTWRKERSVVYQKAMSNAIKRAMHAEEVKEKKRRKAAKGLESGATTPRSFRRASSVTVAEGALTPAGRESGDVAGVSGDGDATVHTYTDDGEAVDVSLDRERNQVVVRKRRFWGLLPAKKGAEDDGEEVARKIRPNVRSINPLPTMISIFKIRTNAMILCASGESAAVRRDLCLFQVSFSERSILSLSRPVSPLLRASVSTCPWQCRFVRGRWLISATHTITLPSSSAWSFSLSESVQLSALSPEEDSQITLSPN